MRRTYFLLVMMLLLALCTACGNQEVPTDSASETAPVVKADESEPKTSEYVEEKPDSPMQTGWITEQILEGNDGEIHYSYYLPENYDGEHTYPMLVVMPGYDMMWFGEESSGSNLSWRGLLAWTELDENLIVVSAQLTDWHEKSADSLLSLPSIFLKTSL